MNAIVLVIDRLHSGFLGCYGNSWTPTPTFNRLAAEALVCDRAYLDSPSLDAICRSYWTGRHAAARPESASDELLAALRRGAGVACTLLTDEAAVAAHPLAGAFETCVQVPMAMPQRPAQNLEETQLARFFATAVEGLSQLRPPFLYWLHSSGLGGPWDAPRELRSQFAMEGDPPPPDLVQPPNLVLPSEVDPDLLLGFRQAYAGQAVLLDSLLEVLFNEVARAPWAAETLLAVVSARGFPLGLHGIVGAPSGQAERLYSELTAVPWLVRLPNGMGAGDRSQALVQPADLCATLRDAWGISPPAGSLVGHSLLPLVRAEADAVRDRACIMLDQEKAIRTPAWYARFHTPDIAELYVKPDDRWEMNDVANRCGEVLEALRTALADYERTILEPTATLPALDGVLVRGLA